MNETAQTSTMVVISERKGRQVERESVLSDWRRRGRAEARQDAPPASTYGKPCRACRNERAHEHNEIGDDGSGQGPVLGKTGNLKRGGARTTGLAKKGVEPGKSQESTRYRF